MAPAEPQHLTSLAGRRARGHSSGAGEGREDHAASPVKPCTGTKSSTRLQQERPDRRQVRRVRYQAAVATKGTPRGMLVLPVGISITLATVRGSHDGHHHAAGPRALQATAPWQGSCSGSHPRTGESHALPARKHRSKAGTKRARAKEAGRLRYQRSLRLEGPDPPLLPSLACNLSITPSLLSLDTTSRPVQG